MKFNPLNGRPDWLDESRDISHTSESNRKNYVRALKYYRQLYQATLSWYDETHHKQILSIYREARRRRKRGENVVVDHIVPLISDEVCGLNVPWNYQIISERENSQKGNKDWPDKHIKQKTLDLEELSCHQLKLI